MLIGHGGHPKMIENAEPVPQGPLSQSIIKFSEKYRLCICVGIAERSNDLIYNSQIVVDHREFLGLQRKIYLSGDENQYFTPGETIKVFNINDIRYIIHSHAHCENIGGTRAIVKLM